MKNLLIFSLLVTTLLLSFELVSARGTRNRRQSTEEVIDKTLVRTEDPRCANVNCNRFKRPFSDNLDINFPSDSTTCSNGTYCPKCLTDTAVWGPLLEALGTGQAIRELVPVLLVNNWLSAELVDTVANILMQEALGFTVDTAPTAIDGTTEIVCCKEPFIEYEKWISGEMLNDDGYFSMKSGPIGYSGQSGLFVPDHTANTYPLATAYNAYRYLDDYKSIFPAGGSTNCSLTIQDDAMGCTDSNYICDKNGWDTTECSNNGRYVPPQCQSNISSCQEIFMTDPTWDAGFFEGLIKNTGLPFVTTYVGGSRVNDFVKQKAAAGDHFAFYWWEPDPLTANVNAQPINFPPNNAECAAKRNSDPNVSLGDCGYPLDPLTKYARRDTLEQDTDLQFFFESFSLSSTDIRTLLNRHEALGGKAAVWNSSCEWIQNNYATWSGWIRNTAPPVDNRTLIGAESDTARIVGLGVGIPLGVVVVGGLLVLLVLHQRAQAAVKHAPKTPPLAMVFTDIESSTMLWEHYGSDMGRAVDLHHDIVRDCISKFDCYEVKTVGDAFIFASKSLLDATMCCLEIQRQLQAADWPKSLICWKGVTTSTSTAKSVIDPENNNDDPASPLAASQRQSTLAESLGFSPSQALSAAQDQDSLFRGLRVRMGIHYCREIDPKFDRIHGRYDYYGHDMNMSARVQAIAAGGQVLMSEETYQVLHSDPSFSVLSEEVSTKLVSVGATFKGVQEAVPVFQILPQELKHRRFPDLEGAPGDEVQKFGDISSRSISAHGTGGGLVGNSDTVSMVSGISGAGAQSTASSKDQYATVKTTLDTILKSFESEKEQEGFINKVANSLKIPAGPTMRRLAFLRKNLFQTAQTKTKPEKYTAQGGTESAGGSSSEAGTHHQVVPIHGNNSISGNTKATAGTGDGGAIHRFVPGVTNMNSSTSPPTTPARSINKETGEESGGSFQSSAMKYYQ